MNNIQEISSTDEGFVQFERALAYDIEDALLTPDQLMLFVFIALKVNYRNREYRTSYREVSEILNVRRLSKNYVNKIMLELKSLGYIEYPDHQGKKGRIIIKLTEKRVRFGLKSSLPKMLESEQKTTYSPSPPAEVNTPQQKWEDARKALKEGYSSPAQLSAGRSANNDNETKKEKDTFEVINNPDSENYPLKERLIPTETFRPNDLGEATCKRIASAIKEPSMNWILSQNRKVGWQKIEAAYGLLREAKNVRNPRRYLNGILKKSFTKQANGDTIGSRTPI